MNPYKKAEIEKPIIEGIEDLKKEKRPPPPPPPV